MNLLIATGSNRFLGQLQASGQGLNRARVLGVIGCRSGDGATFVLAALARLLGHEIVQAHPAGRLSWIFLQPVVFTPGRATLSLLVYGPAGPLDLVSVPKGPARRV